MIWKLDSTYVRYSGGIWRWGIGCGINVDFVHASAIALNSPRDEAGQGDNASTEKHRKACTHLK